MAKKKIEVKEWIEKGEFEGNERDEDDIIDAACNALDSYNTTEILGPVLFKATNGKYYTVVVEAIIVEASKDFVKDRRRPRRRSRVQRMVGSSHP